MKMFLIMVLGLIAGCGDINTGSNGSKVSIPFATDKYNTWFLETDPSTHQIQPIFCMANVKEDSAAPKCYKAERPK